MARRKEPQIPDAVLDQLLSGTAASTAFDRGTIRRPIRRTFHPGHGITVSFNRPAIHGISDTPFLSRLSRCTWPRRSRAVQTKASNHAAKNPRRKRYFGAHDSPMIL